MSCPPVYGSFHNCIGLYKLYHVCMLQILAVVNMHCTTEPEFFYLYNAIFAYLMLTKSVFSLCTIYLLDLCSCYNLLHLCLCANLHAIAAYYNVHHFA